ncbi:MULTISPECIES: SusC/RagA family TonB-linked outer membrane protein [Flavobacterium]|nr:SusC/RagA family TonB-linked outer membrane protein [Flavobacterium sp. N1846]
MRSKFKWIFTLLMALTMQFSFAQEKTITGTVSDASGPLPGVNVVVQGTTRGVQTNFDGSYSIKAKEGEKLVYSFMGMGTVTKVVGASSVMNATMQDDAATQLKEVVVTAVGIKKRQDAITSENQVVKAKEITQAANPNVVQSLTGKVSGLQINTTSSGVAATTKVVLRGARSISSSNEALVVIDGAISNIATLQQIAPELIDNVNVLKGAQGAALYGSDGVNGVIIVNTKKGSKGDKLSVNVNSAVDFSSIAYMPQSQLRYGQGWDGTFSSFENGSWGPEFDGSMQPVGLPQPDGTYFMAPYSPIKDHMKNFFKNGTIYQNGISLSGGDINSGYFNFGANRTQNDFVVEGDELKQNSFLFRAGKKIGKWSLEGNVNYITQDIKQVGQGTINASLYDDLLNTASNIPVELFSAGINSSHWNVYYLSPYWRIKNQREFRETNRFTAGVTLGYEINKNIDVSYLANLRLNNFANMNYDNGFVDTYSATYGARGKGFVSQYFKGNQSDRIYYGDLLVNFNYNLTDNISLKANLGNNLQDTRQEFVNQGGTNLEVPGIYNMSNVLNPAQPSTLDNRTVQKRKIGVFANIDLGYKDYLFLNLTGRNDWSSVFAKNNNSYFYPSAGVSFVPTKAFGLEDSFLNYAKVTANYTRVGNDNGVQPYDINKVVALGDGFPFANNSYVLDRTLTNPGITPEFVTTKEVSAKLGFLKDRITLSGSYYVTDTDDLITDVSTSSTTGAFSLLDNVGSMQTKGNEIELGVTPFRSEEPRGFTWDARLSYTHYKSIITKVSADANAVELRNAGIVGIFAEVGEEYPLIKGTSYLRDDYGRVIVDDNGLPTIDNNFKKLGSATPDYILGFNSAISYKGFRLSTTIDYRTGHKFYSNTKSTMAFNGKLIETAENRTGFIMPNSSYDYNGDGSIGADEANGSIVTAAGGTPSYINYVNNFYTGAAENFVLDASALKIRELSLGYTLDPKFTSKLGLEALSFSVNARNFYTWLPKQNKGYNDPETAEGTGNLTSGLAFNNRYPNQKTIGFALNLKF